MDKITLEQSEQLQQDIITHGDGLPEDLLNQLCQTVVDYRKQADDTRVYAVSLTYCETIQADDEKTAIDIACQNYEANSCGLNDLEAVAEELSQEDAEAQGYGESDE